MRPLFVIALLALPFAARAQTGTVNPGMSRAQVVSALGEPATSRTASEYTYLFYRNDCGRACGMNDLVVLRRDSVVDAIFRSTSRTYTGTSSSPMAEVHEVERPHGVRRARPRATVAAHKESPVAMPAPAASPKAAVHASPAAPVKPATAAAPATIAKPAASAAPAKPATPTPAATPPVAKPAAASQPAPAAKLHPSAPNDTRPTVPAGEPPVRKAPAPVVPPAPAPKPTPKPAP